MFQTNNTNLEYGSGRTIKARRGARDDGLSRLDKLGLKLMVGSLEFPLLPLLRLTLEPNGTIAQYDNIIGISIDNMVYTPNIMTFESEAVGDGSQAASYTIQHNNKVVAISNLTAQSVAIECKTGDMVSIMAINLSTGATTNTTLQAVDGQAYKLSSYSQTITSGSLDISGGEVIADETTKTVCLEWALDTTGVDIKELSLSDIYLNARGSRASPAFNRMLTKESSYDLTLTEATQEYRAIVSGAAGAPVKLPPGTVTTDNVASVGAEMAKTACAYLFDITNPNKVFRLPNGVPVELEAGTYKVSHGKPPISFLPQSYLVENVIVTQKQSELHNRVYSQLEAYAFKSEAVANFGSEQPELFSDVSYPEITITEQDVTDKKNIYTYIIDVSTLKLFRPDYNNPLIVYLGNYTYDPKGWLDFKDTTYLHSAVFNGSVEYKSKLVGPTALTCVKSEEVIVDTDVSVTPTIVTDTRKTEHTISLTVTPLN